jgi:hypothetical protein
MAPTGRHFFGSIKRFERVAPPKPEEAEVLRKEQPLRIPRAAPLLQPERGRARRRGLIRTLADTFRNDIRDQEVRIN